MKPRSVYFQKNHQRAFGTYPLRGKVLTDALEEAVKAGYRAIDTAQMYENEEHVGAFLASCGIPRSEFFITTKVQPLNFTPERFEKSVIESLSKLGISETDVLLLHWPDQRGNNAVALELLGEAAKKGLAKHVGISNYTAKMMKDAKAAAGVPLATNQVEFHPLLNQDILLKAAAETEIPLSSYCSVARGKVFEESLFEELAGEYGKKPSQIVLQWILQKGVSINTMSTKPANIAANYALNNFCLSNIDMAKIDGLTAKNYRIVDKNLVPTAPDWD